MRKLVFVACVLLGCDRSEPPQAAPAPQLAPSSDARPADTPPNAEPMEPADTPDPEGPDNRAAPTCVAEYSFDSDSSVLDEQRRRGGAARWDDFATRYDAAYLEPESDHPVEVVAAFRIGDTPLLWFRADYSAAVVNAAVLESLTVVDATSTSPTVKTATASRSRSSSMTQVRSPSSGLPETPNAHLGVHTTAACPTAPAPTAAPRDDSEAARRPRVPPPRAQSPR